MAADAWELQLTTLAGREERLEVSAGASVRELFALAAARLEVRGPLRLLLGDLDLRRHTGLLREVPGLADGSRLAAVLTRPRPSWTHSLRPSRDAADTVQLRPSAEEPEGDAVVAEFASGQGYRCAVSEALPGDGRSAVVLRVGSALRFHAIGLHAAPDETLPSGPLDGYGWIGESAHGLCLYDLHTVRHDARSLEVGGDFLTSFTNCLQLPSKALVLLVVDHDRRTVRWSVRRDEAATTCSTVECDLPASLQGRELHPVLSQTSSGGTVMQISAADPDDWPMDGYTKRLDPWGAAHREGWA